MENFHAEPYARFLMHELKTMHKDKKGRLREEKGNTVSYKLGNETIIQPVSSTLKDNATLMTILNIVIGLIVGAAVVWFLVVPTLKQDISTKNNQEIIAYSERISALESELDIVEKDLSGYIEQSEATEAAKVLAEGTRANYDALVSIMQRYYGGNYNISELVDEIMQMNVESLGEQGKSAYDTLSKALIEEECSTLYAEAITCYEASVLSKTITRLERINAIDEDYADGQPMLLMLKVYRLQKKSDEANKTYQRILELFPDTTVAAEARSMME